MRDSPEVALDLVLDVVRAGRAKKTKKKKGIGNMWRFDTNASAAEAFAYVLERADRVRGVSLRFRSAFATLSAR